jgi:hypothetical protein
MSRSAILIIALTVIFGGQATAQEQHLHGDRQANASWYPGMKQPGSGASCCSNHDCRLSSYCSTDDVPDGVVVQGACLRIPYERLIPPPVGVLLAPDEVHVCARGLRILCVVGGAGV